MPVCGLGAAVTLGLSAFFIHHLHELRAYTLYALWTALTMWAYWRIIRAKRTVRPRLYLAFLAGVVGLVYTHYLAALVVVAIGLYHLLFAPKNRAWWAIPALGVVAFVLYLPWLEVAFRAISNVSADSTRRFFALDALAMLRELLSRFSNENIALLAVFGWYATRRPNRSAHLIAFLTIVTFALTALFNAQVPFISDARYLMALWPLLAVWMGMGIAAMATSRLRPGALMGVWALACFWLVFAPAQVPYSETNWVTHLAWDTLAEQLRPYARPGDALIFSLPRYVPNWIHDPVARHYLHDVPVDIHLLESLIDTTPDTFRRHAQDFVGDSARVWVALAPRYAPSDLARDALEWALGERFLNCGIIYDSPDIRLDLFARSPDDSPAARVQFGEDIELTLLYPVPTTASDALQVLARWSVSVPAGSYAAAFHVDDADGNFVAQIDYGLPAPSPDCHLSNISLDTLPSGQYTLYAIVYHRETGERLTGVNIASGERGERLALGGFVIP